ncbi:glutamic acid-rcih protein [Cyclospora cayetanensis]|uniref:Glutamic acid-rcih protein n=1 Tax=Cyclospora cayetanensis TaxID=88456 RepID=A0A1D3CW84_9EIME|nr:glutamic acid-rcih protein [Cyclospora cayetanensis]
MGAPSSSESEMAEILAGKIPVLLQLAGAKGLQPLQVWVTGSPQSSSKSHEEGTPEEPQLQLKGRNNESSSKGKPVLQGRWWIFLCGLCGAEATDEEALLSREDMGTAACFRLSSFEDERLPSVPISLPEKDSQALLEEARVEALRRDPLLHGQQISAPSQEVAAELTSPVLHPILRVVEDALPSLSASFPFEWREESQQQQRQGSLGFAHIRKIGRAAEDVVASAAGGATSVSVEKEEVKGSLVLHGSLIPPSSSFLDCGSKTSLFLSKRSSISSGMRGRLTPARCCCIVDVEIHTPMWLLHCSAATSNKHGTSAATSRAASSAGRAAVKALFCGFVETGDAKAPLKGHTDIWSICRAARKASVARFLHDFMPLLEASPNSDSCRRVDAEALQAYRSCLRRLLQQGICVQGVLFQLISSGRLWRQLQQEQRAAQAAIWRQHELPLAPLFLLIETGGLRFFVCPLEQKVQPNEPPLPPSLQSLLWGSRESEAAAAPTAHSLDTRWTSIDEQLQQQQEQADAFGAPLLLTDPLPLLPHAGATLWGGGLCPDAAALEAEGDAIWMLQQKMRRAFRGFVFESGKALPRFVLVEAPADLPQHEKHQKFLAAAAVPEAARAATEALLRRNLPHTDGPTVRAALRRGGLPAGVGLWVLLDEVMRLLQQQDPSVFSQWGVSGAASAASPPDAANAEQQLLPPSSKAQYVATAAASSLVRADGLCPLLLPLPALLHCCISLALRNPTPLSLELQQQHYGLPLGCFSPSPPFAPTAAAAVQGRPEGLPWGRVAVKPPLPCETACSSVLLLAALVVHLPCHQSSLRGCHSHAEKTCPAGAPLIDPCWLGSQGAAAALPLPLAITDHPCLASEGQEMPTTALPQGFKERGSLNHEDPVSHLLTSEFLAAVPAALRGGLLSQLLLRALSPPEPAVWSSLRQHQLSLFAALSNAVEGVRLGGPQEGPHGSLLAAILGICRLRRGFAASAKRRLMASLDLLQKYYGCALLEEGVGHPFGALLSWLLLLISYCGCAVPYAALSSSLDNSDNGKNEILTCFAETAAAATARVGVYADLLRVLRLRHSVCPLPVGPPHLVPRHLPLMPLLSVDKRVLPSECKTIPTATGDCAAVDSETQQQQQKQCKLSVLAPSEATWPTSPLSRKQQEQAAQLFGCAYTPKYPEQRHCHLPDPLLPPHVSCAVVLYNLKRLGALAIQWASAVAPRAERADRAAEWAVAAVSGSSCPVSEATRATAGAEATPSAGAAAGKRTGCTRLDGGEDAASSPPYTVKGESCEHVLQWLQWQQRSGPLLFSCGLNEEGPLGLGEAAYFPIDPVLQERDNFVSVAKGADVWFCCQPQQVVALPGAVRSVSAGVRCSAAVTTEGLLFNWGAAGCYREDANGSMGTSSNGALIRHPADHSRDYGLSRALRFSWIDVSVFSDPRAKSRELEHPEHREDLVYLPALLKGTTALPRLKAMPSLPAATFAAVCCGPDFCAAVTAEGGLYTWGNNASGVLEAFLFPRELLLVDLSLVPLTVLPLVHSILAAHKSSADTGVGYLAGHSSSGDSKAMLLAADSAGYAFLVSTAGEEGAPSLQRGLLGFSQVACGSLHTLSLGAPRHAASQARSAEERVPGGPQGLYTWGSNTGNCLGLNEAEEAATARAPPTRLPPALFADIAAVHPQMPARIEQIAAGGICGAALSEQGDVWLWGDLQAFVESGDAACWSAAPPTLFELSEEEGPHLPDGRPSKGRGVQIRRVAFAAEGARLLLFTEKGDLIAAAAGLDHFLLATLPTEEKGQAPSQQPVAFLRELHRPPALLRPRRQAASPRSSSTTRSSNIIHSGSSSSADSTRLSSCVSSGSGKPPRDTVRRVDMPAARTFAGVRSHSASPSGTAQIFQLQQEPEEAKQLWQATLANPNGQGAAVMESLLDRIDRGSGAVLSALSSGIAYILPGTKSAPAVAGAACSRQEAVSRVTAVSADPRKSLIAAGACPSGALPCRATLSFGESTAAIAVPAKNSMVRQQLEGERLEAWKRLSSLQKLSSLPPIAQQRNPTPPNKELSQTTRSRMGASSLVLPDIPQRQRPHLNQQTLQQRREHLQHKSSTALRDLLKSNTAPAVLHHVREGARIRREAVAAAAATRRLHQSQQQLPLAGWITPSPDTPASRMSRQQQGMLTDTNPVPIPAAANDDDDSSLQLLYYPQHDTTGSKSEQQHPLQQQQYPSFPPSLHLQQHHPHSFLPQAHGCLSIAGSNDLRASYLPQHTAAMFPSEQTNSFSHVTDGALSTAAPTAPEVDGKLTSQSGGGNHRGSCSAVPFHSSETLESILLQDQHPHHQQLHTPQLHQNEFFLMNPSEHQHVLQRQHYLGIEQQLMQRQQHLLMEPQGQQAPPLWPYWSSSPQQQQRPHPPQEASASQRTGLPLQSYRRQQQQSFDEPLHLEYTQQQQQRPANYSL